jgi:hypothetical protein
VRWLCSAAADAISGQRIVANKWDPSLPANEAARRALGPLPWT